MTISRYENLRRLREAKFNRQKLSRAEVAARVERAFQTSEAAKRALQELNAPVTKTPPTIVSVTTPVVTKTPAAGKNKGGRPRRPHPLSNAERQRRYIAKLKAKAAAAEQQQVNEAAEKTAAVVKPLRAKIRKLEATVERLRREGRRSRHVR